MAPIKFEDHIRERLQEREINPSPSSWDKLANKLEALPANKKRNKSIWFAIAAGFIGIIVLVSLEFEGEVIPSQIPPEIVDLSKKKEDIIPLENNTEIVSSKKEISENEDSKKQILKPSKANSVINKDLEVVKENNSKITAIEKPLKKETTETNTLVSKTEPTPEIVKKETYVDSKVEEVVAQVQAMQKKDNAVSAEDIDALLLQAQREIQSKEMINTTHKKVDATALLNSVEYEIETSFRDKVFEALGEGYEKVRTAVIERNN